MAMTIFLEQKVLNALNGVAFQGFSNVYVGLFTSQTGDDGSGVEVTGASYKRKSIKFNAPTKSESFSQISNSTEIDFGVATENWGLITNAAIFDSEKGGNMLYHGALHSSKLIETGDSLRFAVNQLIVSQS